MEKNLSTLLHPSSIAIVGASRSEKKLGFIVLKNIVESGFKGSIYPVNPNSEAIFNLKCFATYSYLPITPDLAIISIPSNLVLESLKEIAQKGTKNVVVFTAGFKEANEQGKALEEEVIKICEDNKINLLGPNCLGFLSSSANLNATFGKVVKNNGNLRFISQSGAIATSMFDWASQINLGFSEFITLGNKAVLNENDFLTHFSKNKDQSLNSNIHLDHRLSNVRPIGLYLESITDGKELVKIASEVSHKNPIFLLKPGKSEAAKKAMQSHTGSLAGEDAVLDIALEQSGIIRCHGVEDLFDLAKAFSWENTPKGPNVAIVSNAGGPAVISADFIGQEGLNLAKINHHSVTLLEKYLPVSANMHNPIDVLGDALSVRYATAIDVVLGQRDVHSLIVILTPQIMTQIYATAEIIGRLSQIHKKPILCAFMGGTDIEKGEQILSMFKIPSFRFPERAIKALGAMWRWQQFRTKKLANIEDNNKNTFETSIHSKIEKLVDTKLGSRVLNNFESNELLKSVGIKTPATGEIRNYSEALEFTDKNGWPVVLKISSEKVLHKSDLGGVIVNIDNKQKLQDSFADLEKRIQKLDKDIQGSIRIQIQRQIKDGLEVIIGIKNDLNFGHVLMFGAGGVLAEIIQDRNLHLLPVGKNEAEILVQKSRIYKLLSGYRGDKAYPTEKIHELIIKLSNLVEMFPQIEELEINPVIVTHEDVWAVDGKTIINA